MSANASKTLQEQQQQQQKDSQQQQRQVFFASLLASTLELWCHQLLYVRGVYPQDSFTSVSADGHSTPLDLDHGCCYVQRHVQVVKYISNAIQLAVPTILSGVVDQLSLIILEKKSTTDASGVVVIEQELERYSLQFLLPGGGGQRRRRQQQSLLDVLEATVTTSSSNQQQQQHYDDDEWSCRLEQAMRNLVLQVHANCSYGTVARKRKTSNNDNNSTTSQQSPNLTFCIRLHVDHMQVQQQQQQQQQELDDNNTGNQQSPEHRHVGRQLVQQAISTGNWWCNPSRVDDKNVLFQKDTTIRIEYEDDEDNNMNHYNANLQTTGLRARPLYQLNQGGLCINFVAHVSTTVNQL